MSSSGCLISNSDPLWGFCSKNLIGPVQSGKPLGLFSVTWPYARFWHLMHLLGRQVPLNLSLACVLTCTSALILWHGDFRKNFNSFGRGKCILVPCRVLVGRRFCDRHDQQGLPFPVTIGNRQAYVPNSMFHVSFWCVDFPVSIPEIKWSCYPDVFPRYVF